MILRIGKVLHDPLCAMPIEATCIGCLLVELRSDATYESPADRAEAYITLTILRDAIDAIIEDLDEGV